MPRVDAVPNNLPAELTSFVGREAERVSVSERLTGNRLVTLTGAGGCGKTRLALHVAADVADRYADGVWWVDLARLSDGSLLGSAVAVSLGIKEVPGQSLAETLIHHLHDDRALVVFDNCEHVVESCAQLVHELLQTCASLSILTTSREPIGVEGEAPWRVPSMQLPEASPANTFESFTRCETVRLFVDRATTVEASFRLTEQNAPAIAEICRRLDGIPLAIELAAARIRMMTPEQIVAGLEDRFRLLTGSTRTAVPRHQTLRASADWSYALLSQEERTVLHRLSAFAGGFTLDAAEEVCSGDGVPRDAVLEILSRLIDRSLVQVGEEAAGVRYRLLETIRQYAAERLAASGGEDAVRERHRRYYLALAERGQGEIEGSGIQTWLPLLEAELDNMRAAFDWGLSTGANDECVRLMSALWQFLFVRGHLTEGRRRFEAALDAGVTEPRLRATALIDVGQLAAYYGDFVATRGSAAEALKIAQSAGDERLEGRALDTLGWSAVLLDPTAAPDLFRSGASLLRRAGDHMYLADALNGLGMAHLLEGNYADARAALEEGVASSRAIANDSLLTLGLGLLGYAVALQGHLARARTHLQESLSIARRIGDDVSTAQALYCLGFADAHHGEREAAEGQISESIGLARRASPVVLMFALLTQGLTRYMRADLEGAKSALEETLALSSDMPASWVRAWSLALLANAARIRGDLDGARVRLDEALAAARACEMRLEVPIDANAKLAREMGDIKRAESLHHDALAAGLEAQSILLIPMELEALAGLAALEESVHEAARLFGAAEAAREAHGLARYVVDQQAYEADVDRVRGALPSEEFRAAWDQGRAMSLDEAVAYASRGRGERKRPSSGWASLTPTEIEVVRNVTKGLTNPQIAERLFVSRGTIKVHLEHIFAKLSVSTRAELAAAAAKRGL